MPTGVYPRHPRIRVPSTCIVCGVESLVQPYRIAQGMGRYCSQACMIQARTTPLEVRFDTQIDRSSCTKCWPQIGVPALRAGRLTHNGRSVPTSHVAWFMATGQWPAAGQHVCHVCDYPPCARNDDEGTYECDGVAYRRFGHLWLGTYASNMADKIAKGRQHAPRGEASPLARLTEAQVLEIRTLGQQGHLTQRQIGAQYGVTNEHVSNILLRKSWTHIP